MENLLREIEEALDNPNPNGYFAYDICKECKGKHCCQHFGCYYSAKDFPFLYEENVSYEEKLEFLVDKIMSGRISIDMIKMGDQFYGPLNPLTNRPDIDKIGNRDGYLFLRARNQGQPVVDFQFFLEERKNFTCVNWSQEGGCYYSEEDRPYTGKMLKPVKLANQFFRCIDTTNYDLFAEEWGKHQLLIYDLYLKVRNMNI